MDDWHQVSWFAVQAKPHHEVRAASYLRQIIPEVFLPMVKTNRLVCGTRRMVTSPLFLGYLFARFCPLTALSAVRNAQGVSKVIGSKNLPVPLSERMMEEIQELVSGDGFIHKEEMPFQCGDRVSIQNGPLTGWIGRVERETDNGKRTLILLEAIEQARVSVERSWLEAVKA